MTGLEDIGYLMIAGSDQRVDALCVFVRKYSSGMICILRVSAYCIINAARSSSNGTMH